MHVLEPRSVVLRLSIPVLCHCRWLYISTVSKWYGGDLKIVWQGRTGRVLHIICRMLSLATTLHNWEVTSWHSNFNGVRCWPYDFWYDLWKVYNHSFGSFLKEKSSSDDNFRFQEHNRFPTCVINRIKIYHRPNNKWKHLLDEKSGIVGFVVQPISSFFNSSFSPISSYCGGL